VRYLVRSRINRQHQNRFSRLVDELDLATEPRLSSQIHESSSGCVNCRL
jgi:hypothetical protein